MGIKLNSLDTTVYNAIPATILLLGPIFLYPHPVNWPDHGAMTDWSIFNIVLAKSPGTVGLAALSGALSLAYNTLQYGIVQLLSATHVPEISTKLSQSRLHCLLALRPSHPASGVSSCFWHVSAALALLLFTMSFQEELEDMADMGAGHIKHPRVIKMNQTMTVLQKVIHQVKRQVVAISHRRFW